MDADMYIYLFILVALCIIYISVFCAYFLLGRKTCKPGVMANTALMVALMTVTCGLIVNMIPLVPRSVTSLFSLCLTMYLARHVLQFSAGRSWAAVGLALMFALSIYFLIVVLIPFD
jgi:hypothetical protein